MSYGSGRFPFERASKLGHMKLVEHEQVSRLIRQFESVEAQESAPVGECTGHIDLSTPSQIRFIVTVDGGEAVIPNTIRREKRIAFINVCAILIEREEIEYLREHPVIDPRDVARVFEGKVWYQAAPLPLSGISIPGQTVRETIRETVDAVLEYTHLYPTLNYLVSRKWDPTYVMGSELNPEAPHMDCLDCGANIWLPKGKINFNCGACGHTHRLSDYLGIGAEGPEDWAREEAAMSLRNVLETLTLFHFIIRYQNTGPIALSQILFVKDGPLLLRAQLSRLVAPIRAFITFVRDHVGPLYLTGITKNGELVDQLDAIKEQLPTPGDFFLPSVRYLMEQISGLRFDPASYRNRVQYGAKVVVRLGPHHVVPLDIPTGDFLTDPKPEDLIGFAEMVPVLATMLSYSHDNGLIPLVLANQYSSISERPSGDILKAFAGKLFS